MTKILSAAVVIIGFTASAALAQMGGHEGMGSQQSHQMIGGQMMSQEMTKDMAGMMKQMNEMMQKLSHPMGHMTVTDHAKMQDMAKVMRDMAAQMNEMAAHMEKGEMDKATVKKMQERMKAMNQSIENLQKEGK
jgi:Spy/CpxP family protein refolding chaperone